MENSKAESDAEVGGLRAELAYFGEKFHQNLASKEAEVGDASSGLAKMNLELAQECELLKSDKEILVFEHQRALASAEKNFNS